MDKNKVKNILPTLGGLLAAIGLVLAHQTNPTVSLIGTCAAAAGAFLAGASAKQYNVTGGTIAQTTEAESRVPAKTNTAPPSQP